MKKEQLLRKIQMINLLFCRGGYKKAEYIKKHNIFKFMGNNCYYHPFKLPAEPFLVGMGSNVFIGTNVSLITHSMENCVFNNIVNAGEPLCPEVGAIKFGDNVFVGANATIMYGVTIGDNCIIAAGSVVTKDIPSGSVVAGIPAKVIGDFDKRMFKFIQNNDDFVRATKEIAGTLWSKQEYYFWK